MRAARKAAAGVLSAAALAAVLGGCGGPSKEEVARCRGLLLDTVAYDTVIRAFEAGKLGSRAHLEAQLGAARAPALGKQAQLGYGRHFFDAQGRLIRYPKLSDRDRGAVNTVMYEDGVFSTVVHGDQTEVLATVDRRAKEVCT